MLIKSRVCFLKSFKINASKTIYPISWKYFGNNQETKSKYDIIYDDIVVEVIILL